MSERGRHWMGRDEFVRRFAGRQADPQLTADLLALAPDTTDDLDSLRRDPTTPTDPTST